MVDEDKRKGVQTKSLLRLVVPLVIQIEKSKNLKVLHISNMSNHTPRYKSISTHLFQEIFQTPTRHSNSTKGALQKLTH